MDLLNGYVEAIDALGELGARKRQIVTSLKSLYEQSGAAVTTAEKRFIRLQVLAKLLMLNAVNLKIREYDEQRAIDMYREAYSPTHSPTKEPKFPKTLEALQASRKDLWALILSLYAKFEVAPTMMEKSALISDIKTGMLRLGAVMHKIKEYDGTATAADWYRNAAIRDHQEIIMVVSAIGLSESPAVAAPANFCAPASLPNGHLCPTSSDVEPEPQGPVDTNGQSDLTTLPPLASEPESEDSVDANVSLDLITPFPLASEPESEDSVDANVSLDLITPFPLASATATTSHNNGVNGALGARINRMLGSLARLADVVRNA